MKDVRGVAVNTNPKGIWEKPAPPICTIDSRGTSRIGSMFHLNGGGAVVEIWIGFRGQN